MRRLRAERLVKSYGKRTVVKGVSLEVCQGEVVGLLGPNGAGKTTTFQMIVGAVKPDAGEIFLDEESLTDWPMFRRALKGLGYLPQEPSIFRKLTVSQNIEAILELQKGMTRQARRERLDSLLDEFKIRHVAGQQGYQLSGGERRRVEIARALVLSPTFLLLDEPFTGIDPIAVGEIQEIIAHLKAQGLGVLMTDHNVRDTLEITDRSYIIYGGEILLSGTAHQLAADPKAREVYLGPRFKL